MAGADSRDGGGSCRSLDLQLFTFEGSNFTMFSRPRNPAEYLMRAGLRGPIQVGLSSAVRPAPPSPSRAAASVVLCAFCYLFCYQSPSD